METINNGDADVIVRNLEKWYGHIRAVQAVSFHVNRGDCFGLLGETT
jgi:ABC-type multidrug transport system ATPase subunit